ncbi:unnamed protein product, partial [Prorocentrum cordatum]
MVSYSFSGCGAEPPSELLATQKEVKGHIHEIYLVSRPTQGLVDPGAGSDLVGRDSLNREAVELARLGLTYVVVPGASGTAADPWSIAGAIEATVLEEDVPHIISASLLDFLGCAIDTPGNSTRVQRLELAVPLAMLASGHRMADVVSPLRARPRAPASALLAYPFLTANAFCLAAGQRPLEMSPGGPIREAARYIITFICVIMLPPILVADIIHILSREVLGNLEGTQ